LPAIASDSESELVALGARFTVNPCSSPSGPLTYHSREPARAYSTRLPAAVGETVPSGSAEAPAPIAGIDSLSRVDPAHTVTPSPAKSLRSRPPCA
jgi:hypothetical protein